MGRYRWLVFGGLALAVTAAAVALLSPGNSAGDLAGTRWALVALNGQPPIADSGPITLEFDNGSQAGGDSGCNSYGAGYTARGTSIRITDVVSTLRACVDQSLNHQESAYLRTLASVASYAVQGDRLILREAAGADALVFTRD